MHLYNVSSLVTVTYFVGSFVTYTLHILVEFCVMYSSDENDMKTGSGNCCDDWCVSIVFVCYFLFISETLFQLLLLLLLLSIIIIIIKEKLACSQT